MERPFLHQALSHSKMESQSEHLQIRKSSCGAGLARDSKLLSFADQLLYFKKETAIHTIILSLCSSASMMRKGFWANVLYFYILFNLFGPWFHHLHYCHWADSLWVQLRNFYNTWLLSWIFRAAWLLWIFSISSPPFTLPLPTK